MLFNPLPRPSKTPNPNSLRVALIAATLATSIAAVGLALGAAGRPHAGPRTGEGAFEKRFPGVTVVVDDSERHDAGADVVRLRRAQDLDR